MILTVGEILSATGGKLLTGNESEKVSSICTDSRMISDGALFVPVIGEHFDAHDFLSDVFSKSAVCAFTSEHTSLEELCTDKRVTGFFGNKAPSESRDKGVSVISVPDTIAALQSLGSWYRRRYITCPVTGVTGSVGKTTTREMIKTALMSELKVFSTKKNANSQIGVPITLTEADTGADVMVIELGMSDFGEMHNIAMTACCDSAVITNIGISHIAQLHSKENIMLEKLHILDGMPDNGTLILNGDDPMLCGLDEDRLHESGYAKGKKINVFFYGTGSNADVRIENTDMSDGYPSFDVCISEKICGRKVENFRMRLLLPGRHMILNAAAALAAACISGVSPLNAAKALESFHALPGRGEIIKTGGVTMINDCYNAAPASMKAGLEVLDCLDVPGKKIAVLADMLELGTNETAYHMEIGTYLADYIRQIDTVLLYGKLTVNIASALGTDARRFEIRHFNEAEDLKNYLTANIRPGDAVLFKGSNSMGLLDVFKACKEHLSDNNT